MIDGLDRVLRDFIVESRENLERLDHEFIALEQNPEDKDLLADIFRTIHTIKGSAGFLSLTKLEQLSHYTEDVLAKLREQKLALDTDLTTTLLSSVDCIKSLLVMIDAVRASPVRYAISPKHCPFSRTATSCSPFRTITSPLIRI